jgi:glycine/D-amino acid oxidase-like deaminating enzyme
MEFPQQARIVIIGGGIVGCSVAYNLAKLGCSDVLLLEQHALSSGSTWHAAGAIGQLRSSANVTRLLGESIKLYSTLEAETVSAGSAPRERTHHWSVDRIRLCPQQRRGRSSLLEKRRL